MKLALYTCTNAVGLFLAVTIVPGLSVPPNATTPTQLASYLFIAAIFTLVQMRVRPLLKVLAFPLYVLTFGLASLVINGLMLQLTSWVTDKLAFLMADLGVSVGLHVGSFTAAVFGAIVIAIISSLLTTIIGR